MNFDDAQPVENPRVEAIRNATVCAAELQFERSSNYLVKHWLGSTAVSVIYGDSNCGKSFFALDVAVHVAAGLPWMGHNTRKGNVLILRQRVESAVMHRVSRRLRLPCQVYLSMALVITCY